jgi:hypothetical protein
MGRTEEEAKTAWCPMVRGAHFNHQDQNAIAGDYGRATTGCIGSACMAWRKDHDSEYDREGNLRGYCGLAGKP